MKILLCLQARQVMYITNLKCCERWKVVEKVQLRGVSDVQEKDKENEDEQEQEEYQQNDSIEYEVLWLKKFIWIEISMEMMLIQSRLMQKHYKCKKMISFVTP